jgi:hypothetical protein
MTEIFRTLCDGGAGKTVTYIFWSYNLLYKAIMYSAEECRYCIIIFYRGS